MGDLIRMALQQVEKMLPERYRLRLVACSAFMGLIGFVYYCHQTYAPSGAVLQLQANVQQEITAAVQPISVKLTQDENRARRQYVEDLGSQILQAAGRCSETHSHEARGLYQSSLTDLLERYENAAGHPYPGQVHCE